MLMQWLQLYVGCIKIMKRKAALERHLEFMSVTPHISTLLLGISGAMEEENAKIMNLTQLVLMQ